MFGYVALWVVVVCSVLFVVVVYWFVCVCCVVCCGCDVRFCFAFDVCVIVLLCMAVVCVVCGVWVCLGV